jgi:hypothetical protein
LKEVIDLMQRESKVVEENGKRFFKNEEGYQKLQKAKQIDAFNKQYLSLGQSSVNKPSSKSIDQS